MDGVSATEKSNDPSPSGKVAIATGGSRGIGAPGAHALPDAGANVLTSPAELFVTGTVLNVDGSSRA